MEIKLRKFQEGGPVEQQQEPQQEQGEQGQGNGQGDLWPRLSSGYGARLR